MMTHIVLDHHTSQTIEYLLDGAVLQTLLYPVR